MNKLKAKLKLKKIDEVIHKLKVGRKKKIGR